MRAAQETRTPMDVYEAIHTRRDVEAFEQTLPAREVIERLIEAATWAPNHRMTEPWRFHVVAGEARDNLGAEVAGWLAGKGEPEAIGVSANAKLMRAPVTIFLSQSGSPDDPVRELEDYAACATAMQNLLLAARAEGLVAHVSTDRMIGYEAIKQHLGLSQYDRVVVMVNVGSIREGATPKQGVRRPAVVTWQWA